MDRSFNIVVIILLVAIFASCRAKKVTESSEYNVTTESSISVESTHTSAQIAQQVLSADSIFVAITADSITSADGTTIHRPRMHIGVVSPKATTIDELNDSVSITLSNEYAKELSTTDNRKVETKPTSHFAYIAIIILTLLFVSLCIFYCKWRKL